MNVTIDYIYFFRCLVLIAIYVYEEPIDTISRVFLSYKNIECFFVMVSATAGENCICLASSMSYIMIIYYSIFHGGVGEDYFVNQHLVYQFLYTSILTNE